MNKIFRKCRDFGLLIRLNDLKSEDSLSCVRSLKKANLPLCVVSMDNNPDWENQLREIAFKEDLFIAVEGIKNLEQAYTAAGNGAQFFILKKFCSQLMNDLKKSGFFFIPTITDSDELSIVEEIGLEAVISDNIDILKNSRVSNVLNCQNVRELNIKEPNIFNIIDLPKQCSDYELWANRMVKDFLNLNYTEMIITNNLTAEEEEFVHIFSSTNKCSITKGSENSVTLECSDFIRTVNYFKWRGVFINPNNTVIKNDNIIKGILDKKINNFTIVLKEVV